MFKRIIFFSLAIALLSACSAPKESTKTVAKKAVPPAGIQFNKVKNYKNFALINLPSSGKGFGQNQDVDIERNRNDADEFVPGVRYDGTHFLKWSTIRGAEGNLDEQFAALKKELLQNQIKENSEVIFEKKKIGEYETALVKITTPYRSGSVKYAYGYLVSYGNKAALFMVEDTIMPSSELASFTQPLEEAMQYMIKTVKFK